MINALFLIALTELFLGGGGRLFELGSGTVRMYLFATCLVVYAACMYLRIRPRDGQSLALGLVFLYLLVHVGGLLVGTFNGAGIKDMMTEFQHSLYWLAAPFFALMLQSPAMVYRVSFLVRFCGMFLAIAYLTVLALLAVGKISIIQVLPLLVDSGEVFVRGDNFLFYKGFLYLGLATVFFVGIRGKFWVLCTLTVFTALILTLTRGFLLATSIAVLMMLVSQGRRLAAALAVIGMMVAAFIVFVLVPALKGGVAESQSQSLAQRTSDFRQIVSTLTPQSLIIGEGYAAEENDRIDIENTFLWATWKFGIPGLAFWLMPLFVNGYFYLSIRNRRNNPAAGAFFFGTVLVYAETVTNPFLNNPIGLSFVLVALFSLRTLAKESRAQRLTAATSTSLGEIAHAGQASN
jgi:hypothetical protein